MSSNPVSVRNKSSKFTLTKKEFYNNINKIGNNINTNKIFNNLQNEYVQYKKSALKKCSNMSRQIRLNLQKSPKK